MKNKTCKKATAGKVPAKKTTCCKKCGTTAKASKKDVIFTVHADKGKAVYLAGQFNDWDPTAKKMSYKAKEGIYSATLALEPGDYEYKFVIDGTWCADPENANAVPNDQGTYNSVVTVK